jgi:hypothetical protein
MQPVTVYTYLCLVSLTIGCRYAVEECDNLGSEEWATFTNQQKSNACTVVRVGKDAGFPEYGWVVAIAVALVESHIQALPSSEASSCLPLASCLCCDYSHDLYTKWLSAQFAA